MSLFRDLLELGVKAASSPAVVEATIDVLTPLAIEHLDESYAVEVVEVLGFAKKHSAAVAEVGVKGLVALAGAHAELGPLEARLLFIRTRATAAEVSSAQAAAREATLKEHEQSTWEDVCTVAVALAPYWKQVLPLLGLLVA